MVEIEESIEYRGTPTFGEGRFARRTILEQRIRRRQPALSLFGLPEDFDSAEEERIEGFLVLQQLLYVHTDDNRNLPAVRKLKSAIELCRLAFRPHSLKLPPLSFDILES